MMMMLLFIVNTDHQQHFHHRYAVSSFVVIPRKIHRRQTLQAISSPTPTATTILTTSSSLLGSSPQSTIDTLDWEIVENYTIEDTNDIHTKLSKLLLYDDDGSIQKYCQRMNIDAITTSTTNLNLTVPIALMIFDNELYPSLSKARKACRQKKIVWIQHQDEQQQQQRKALVGDRFVVSSSDSDDNDKDWVLARRETKQVLDRQQQFQQQQGDNNNIQDTNSSNYDVCSIVRPYFNLQIVYEDDYMAIVNKPAGVLVYPEDGKNKNSISYALPYFLNKPTMVKNNRHDDDDDDIVLNQPVPVHRLDFATSGLLVIGKTKNSARFLATQFEFRKAQKKYIAMVYGHPNNDNASRRDTNDKSNGILKFLPENESTLRTNGNTAADGWNLADCLLEDKRSTTYWRIKSTHEFIIASKNNTTDAGALLSSEDATKLPISMIEMKPITGRYHQLRRQMAYMYETPIVGDPKYAREYVKKVFQKHDGGSSSSLLDRYHRGLMLCSNEIVIAHPFYNTPNGKKIWNANAIERNFSNSTLGSSVVIFEDDDGTIMVNATIKLPKKFDKFLNVMERMTKYSNPMTHNQ